MSEQKVNLLQDINAQVDSILAHAQKKYPDRMWMFDIQKAYWDEVANAHANGKKLIYVGASAPIELVYALDAVPFFLDMIPTRLASQEALASRYIDAAEQYVAPSMCGIDKVDLGAILLDELGDRPDAFLYTTVPCDSSRVAYPAIEQILNVPTKVLDVPFRKDERGYKYLADQMRDCVPFLEEITGNKLDWDKLKEVIEISNESHTLMKQIADLRKLKPCPLPGRLLVLNEMTAAMPGHPAMRDFLKAQYQVGKYMADNGLGAVKEERFRVSWLQNMLWSNTGILDWMEREYGAVLIMDIFGYQESKIIVDMDNEEEVFMGLAERALALPMIHGAAGPVEDYIKLIDGVMADYDINVSMFVGHVGCKHTWAAGKIVKDLIQEKYGYPTLTIDVDAIDGRYKKTDEIKAAIAEYMETIIENQKVKA